MFVHDSIVDKPEISANGYAQPFLELTLFERQSPYILILCVYNVITAKRGVRYYSIGNILETV